MNKVIVWTKVKNKKYKPKKLEEISGKFNFSQFQSFVMD
jgi:hypothetical protein